MTGTLSAITVALEMLLVWPTFLFIILGALIGMIFGALPGLGGVIALALLIPVTFGMDPTSAMVLFGSTLGGVAFGGSVSAILINVPGTGPNAATLLDGYPMSRQGRAGEALGISATASAMGATFGLFVLIIAIPVVREVILAFQPPEFFWLAVFGLTIIAVAAGDDLLKGLVAGGLGLLFSFIGQNQVTGVLRYTFDIQYLWDGLQLIPAIIGLFAVAEVMKLAGEGGTIAKGDAAEVGEIREVLKGGWFVVTHPSLFLRSSIIGVLIGMIPGAGGTVANFISYMSAMQTSDDPDSFGKGNPEGVLASEAANDAKDGGSLLPAVVFGIPGSAAIAVMLGGFILHGLNPGRQLVGEQLPLLFVLVFSLLFSNLFTSIVGISIANQLSKLTKIPVNLLIFPILIVSFVGAFAIRNSFGDVVLALTFGFIGYGMIVFDYSRVAVVIALILGPLAEQAFLQSLQISSTTPSFLFLLTRPISIALIILTLLSLAHPFVRAYRSRPTATKGGDT